MITDYRRLMSSMSVTVVEPGKRALLAAQKPQPANRRVGLNQLAVSSIRTAEAMIRRARPVPGTTPAQIVAMLQAQAKERS